MSWLDDVQLATSEAESPRSYIYWAALASIAAIVKKNIFLNRGGIYKLYPNIYVLLVGKSGLRKSFPPEMAKRLVKITNNTRVISGQNSIQAIIDELSKTKTQPDGSIQTGASCFLQSGEFSNLIMEDPGSLTILTEWYDTDFVKEWKKTLKSGIASLKEICITMLGATNLDHFHDRIMDKDIKGGFIARTIVVLETQKGKVNPLTEDVPEIDYESLAKRLQEISKLSGQFKWSKAGKKLYNEWYMEYSSKDIDDKTGTAMRIHDQILKISMLLSLAEKDELYLEVNDINGGIEACMNLIQNTNRVTGGKGKSEFGTRTNMIIEELIASENFTIGKVKLLQKYYGEFDVHDLNRMVDTLEAGNYIETVGTGINTHYRLKDVWAKKWLEIKRKEGKN